MEVKKLIRFYLNFKVKHGNDQYYVSNLNRKIYFSKNSISKSANNIWNGIC